MRRILRVIVHNWPLKLAAVGLASLLYGGLVLSQSTQVYPGAIEIQLANQPQDTFVLTPPEQVTEVRYFSSAGIRAIGSTFQASIDLSNVKVDSGPVSVPVNVTSVDDRITVIGFSPDVVTVQLDQLKTIQVPVRVSLGTVPNGLEIGDTTVAPSLVSVSGPSSVVDRVVAARASVEIQATPISVDQDVRLIPVDDIGDAVSPVNVDPRTARVTIPVFTDRRSRTLPVSPVITGTPAAGFEVASVSVDPSVATVEGNPADLAALSTIDTVPISITGTSKDTVIDAAMDLPVGIVPVGGSTVHVVVTLRPVTATRTFDAGLRLVGARSDRTYTLAADHVLVTIGGSVADLDRLQGSTLIVDLSVAALGIGTFDVPVTADLPTGLTLVAVSPTSVSVTVTASAASPPGTSPTPTP